MQRDIAPAVYIYLAGHLVVISGTTMQLTQTQKQTQTETYTDPERHGRCETQTKMHRWMEAHRDRCVETHKDVRAQKTLI